MTVRSLARKRKHCKGPCHVILRHRFVGSCSLAKNRPKVDYFFIFRIYIVVNWQEYKPAKFNLVIFVRLKIGQKKKREGRKEEEENKDL